MGWIESCVRNPVKVTVGALLTLLFGIIALVRMPMQLVPEVQTPSLSIETQWPGASPLEVEREIIREQEEQLKSVEGLVEIRSAALEGNAEIDLEFAIGTNMNEALLKVNSRLQQVAQYPEDVDEPVISTSSASTQPIARFIVCEKPPEAAVFRQAIVDFPEHRQSIEYVLATSNPNRQLLRLRTIVEKYPELSALLPEDKAIPELRRFVENNIEARFERVDGVSAASIRGGLEDELQIVVDPQKLAARRLTIDDIRRVLDGENRDTSGGDYSEGKRRYLVRTLSQFRDPGDVANRLLATREGSPVYVRDVAEVRFGFKKPTGIARRNGGYSISLQVQRETGANVLDVMEGLKAAVADLNANVLHPRGLQLIQTYDETEYINAAVGLVNENIIVGSALTMIVLMLFLHLGSRTLLVIPFIALSTLLAAFGSPWWFVITLAIIIGAGLTYARGALIVGLAIPISIVGTFLVLDLLGRTLNVISLAGLAFAVGMLVDNAVVVLENIYRHYEDGERPLTAAVRGTQEVWGAVLASTLTTLAVFLPVLFVQQEAGQLFRDIAIAISAGVGLSMIVSITIIPTATALLLPRQPLPDGSEDAGSEDALGEPLHAATPSSHSHVSSKSSGPTLIARWLEGLAVQSVQWTVKINRWFLQGQRRRLWFIGLTIVLSVGLTYWIWPKVEYLPTGNRNQVFGSVIAPTGYNFDEFRRLGEMVENRIKPFALVDPKDPEAASLKYPTVRDYFVWTGVDDCFIGMSAEEPMRVSKLPALLKDLNGSVPGMTFTGNQSSLFGRGAAGRNIEIEIAGPDMDRLLVLGRRVLEQVPIVLGKDAQAFPEPVLELSNPELHVEPKRLQAQEVGMSATSIGYAVNTLVDGAYAGDFDRDGNKIDITIIGTPDAMQRSQDLAGLPIATPTGKLVPLGAIAETRLSSGPQSIFHRERQRAVTVTVVPTDEMPLQQALEQIETQIVAPLRTDGSLDGGYSIALSGTADRLRATWDALKWNVVLALLITYLLMAALFESWLYPLVIIMSVPLGAIGGVLALRALEWYVVWVGEKPQSLDVLTMLGFVILIGTVVNNPILIVHQTINLMREGLSMRQAILDSVASRVRPIFMTTTTTIIGLVPLVLIPGAGSELYRGLGAVVLGGLTLSTLVTLVFVPTLFSLAMEWRGRWDQWWRPKPAPRSPLETMFDEPVSVGP
jgi:hydrophobic/amphiphilic exporter-1 (mainly G- bacteria), HAE1 family